MFQRSPLALVATDAIGITLNMDVADVAFAGLEKFDGRRDRQRSFPKWRKSPAAPGATLLGRQRLPPGLGPECSNLQR